MKKALKRYLTDFYKQFIIVIVGIIATVLYHLFIGFPFEWREYSPIPDPIFVRMIFSFLVFHTIGAFLYYEIRWWQIWYSIFHFFRITHRWKECKFYFWCFLIGFVYYLTGVIIDTLNCVLSSIFNVLLIILYTTPYIGIVSLVVALILLVSCRYELEGWRIVSVRK